jgi:glutamate-1-semialdehyde aminotransferase
MLRRPGGTVTAGVADAAAPMLFGHDPAAITAAVQQAQREASARGINRQRAQRVGGLLLNTGARYGQGLLTSP